MGCTRRGAHQTLLLMIEEAAAAANARDGSRRGRRRRPCLCGTRGSGVRRRRHDPRGHSAVLFVRRVRTCRRPAVHATLFEVGDLGGELGHLSFRRLGGLLEPFGRHLPSCIAYLHLLACGCELRLQPVDLLALLAIGYLMREAIGGNRRQ